ncbi:hypothetical protein C0992_011526, partial [Termitomyces sp. T32_za158]
MAGPTESPPAPRSPLPPISPRAGPDSAPLALPAPPEVAPPVDRAVSFAPPLPEPLVPDPLEGPRPPPHGVAPGGPRLGAPFTFHPPSFPVPVPAPADTQAGLPRPRAPGVLIQDVGGETSIDGSSRQARVFHGLPPEVGRLLSAADKVFPQKVIRVLENGFFEYIPLNLLTDEACRLAAHEPPPPDSSYLFAGG